MSALPSNLVASPSFRVVVPVSPVKVSGLFVSSYNCEPVTASFEFALTSPFAKPVIFLSLALIPSFLTVTPPTFKPSPLNVLSPAVTEFSFKSLFNATLILPSSTFVETFSSAPTTSMDSPSFLFTD